MHTPSASEQIEQSTAIPVVVTLLSVSCGSNLHGNLGVANSAVLIV